MGEHMIGKLASRGLLVVLLLLSPGVVLAWVYPEHRNIALEAIKELSPEQGELLARLWADARVGHEARLCPLPSEGDQGYKPTCIDFAAWPAIGGDHSCSATNLLHNVLDTDWIIPVAQICAELDEKLAAAKTEAQRSWPLTKADQQLAEEDPEYASRAGASTAHFLLYRTKAVRDPKTYAGEAFAVGAPPNSLAIYAIYHLTALRFAAVWGDPATPAEAKPQLARNALAAEGFALHFLEDSFAAGHAAGSWGDTAERKGTHDYYNLHGLEVMDWNNEPFILDGDGHLGSEELGRVARIVKISLSQLFEATDPTSRAASAVMNISLAEADQEESFDTCTSMKMPPPIYTSASAPLLAETLRYTPVPSLGPGSAALPRHRADIGAFAGVAGGGWFGGTQSTASDSSSQDAAALFFAARFGVGLEDLAGPSGDGQLWLQAGIQMRNSEAGVCQGTCGGLGAGTLVGIGSRNALALRLRVPFWLIPGDLIVATPILALTSMKTLTQMGIVSVNGGLIPWQAAIPTKVGRFQFILGREVGLNLYGYTRGADKVTLIPITSTGYGQPIQYEMKSMEWEFPLVEWRLWRTFAGKQASTFVLQLGGGYEHSTSFEPVAGGPSVNPPPRYLVFLRASFDGRLYF
jgi:hypothetical protein